MEEQQPQEVQFMRETTAPPDGIAEGPSAPADTGTGPSTELVADVAGAEVRLPADAPMPPPEPGHKGPEELAGGPIFDPNAARRFAEGRGPGLQDSEVMQPAHWPQPPAVAPDQDSYLAGLRRERDMAAQDGRDTGEIEAEIARVEGEQQAAAG